MFDWVLNTTLESAGWSIFTVLKNIYVESTQWILFLGNVKFVYKLTLKVPIPQNGQTYSNKPTNCLSESDHSVGLTLKELILKQTTQKTSFY